jgi:glucan phosphoethanolaminetransferase (alkaline phosphatase superfamily)
MSIAALIMISWGIFSAILMVAQVVYSKSLLSNAVSQIKYYLIFFLSLILHVIAIVISAIAAASIKGNLGDGFFVTMLLLFYFIACVIGLLVQKPKKAIDLALSFTLPLSAAFNSSVIFIRRRNEG